MSCAGATATASCSAGSRGCRWWRDPRRRRAERTARWLRTSPAARLVRPWALAVGTRGRDAIEHVARPFDRGAEREERALQRRAGERTIAVECGADRAERVEAPLVAELVLAHD